MSKVFEDAFSDVQSGLISLCLEAVDENAEKVYAYCSIEEKSRTFNAFFCVNGEIKTLDEITDNVALIRQFLEFGTGDLLEIKRVCKEHDRPVPTEIKMVYDVQSGHFEANYQYVPVCDGDMDKSSYDVFMEWFNEVKG